MKKKKKSQTEKAQQTELSQQIALMEEAFREIGAEQQCRQMIDALLPELYKIDEDLSESCGRQVVEHITWRVKSPESIVKKLRRKNREVSLETAVSTLKDLAGIRVVCPFQDDVYRVAGAIKKLPDYELIKEKNYIARPKASGYRSIHLILRPKPPEPGLAGEISYIEIQVRSVAMNYWAILDYQLCYKNEKKGVQKIRKELKNYAIAVAQIDKQMLRLRKEIEKL